MLQGGWSGYIFNNNNNNNNNFNNNNNNNNDNNYNNNVVASNLVRKNAQQPLRTRALTNNKVDHEKPLI